MKAVSVKISVSGSLWVSGRGPRIDSHVAVDAVVLSAGVLSCNGSPDAAGWASAEFPGWVA